MTTDDSARDLYANDRSASAFGIELTDSGPDMATVRMQVRPDMCNGFQIMHGGMTFLLADSAMAFASNSTNAQGEMALAASAEIDWLAPVRVGDVLTATAARRDAGGRSAIWDIEVATADGVVVALVRGRTRKITARA